MTSDDDPAAHAEALVKTASDRLLAGDKAGAMAAGEQAIAADPANLRAHAVLGGALEAMGRLRPALDSYDRALALDPDDISVLVSRGNVLTELKRWTEALACFDAAIALQPQLPQPHGNRARVLCLLDRAAEGLEAATRATELQPSYARGWLRRGDAFLAMERHEEALDSYGRAAALAPSDYALVGMSNGLKGLGRYDEAIACLDRAEALRPGAPLPPYHRSLVRLLLGDFQAGWRDYEARWRLPSFIESSSSFVTEALRRRLTLFPERQDFVGRKVLVAAEQGVGDQLMHASMLPDLSADAREVTWICDRRLHRLLSHGFPAVRFVDARDTPYLDNDFDRIVASGSLAHAYRKAPGDCPGTPFAAPREAVVEAWSRKLGPRRAKLRIGLSWRGGSQRTGQARRSMSLAGLQPLLARTDCEFVSLQYGDAQADVAEAAAETGVDVRLFPAGEIDDFEDLAALVGNLDLVVSVQTALVHLCGAIGRPALVMVPLRPEWRYQAAGESMPWYDSVRLVRQARQWDWDAVVAEIVRAVGARAERA